MGKRSCFLCGISPQSLFKNGLEISKSHSHFFSFFKLIFFRPFSEPSSSSSSSLSSDSPSELSSKSSSLSKTEEKGFVCWQLCESFVPHLDFLVQVSCVSENVNEEQGVDQVVPRGKKRKRGEADSLVGGPLGGPSLARFPPPYSLFLFPPFYCFIHLSPEGSKKQKGFVLIFSKWLVCFIHISGLLSLLFFVVCFFPIIDKLVSFFRAKILLELVVHTAVASSCPLSPLAQIADAFERDVLFSLLLLSVCLFLTHTHTHTEYRSKN